MPAEVTWALQVVLRKAINKDKDGAVVHEKIVEFANRGFRSLGISKNPSMVHLSHFSQQSISN